MTTNRRAFAQSLAGAAALALPTPTLPHLLVRSVEPTNVGDFFFGLALFAIAGDPTPTLDVRTALATEAGARILETK